VTRVCGEAPVPLREAPSDRATQLSVLEPGQEFAILDITGGWAWGYRRLDHRVGYVPVDALTARG